MERYITAGGAGPCRFGRTGVEELDYGKTRACQRAFGRAGQEEKQKIWVISGTAAAVLLGGYLGLCAWVNGTDRILPNVSVAGWMCPA